MKGQSDLKNRWRLTDIQKDLENYLKKKKLEQLFKKLGVPNSEILAEAVRHFTTKEAEKRDEIVTNYFGQRGIDRIVDAIVKFLLAKPRLPSNAKVLDAGAGSGFFTAKIAQKIHTELPKVNFYAMDLTPAMLVSLAKKKARITPFIGIAEDIEGSIKEARSTWAIPYKFDAAFSTLMLHHSSYPKRVFRSLKEALKEKGRAVVVDLCKHNFEEFKTEMGDVHLGFKPESVRKMAQGYFSSVTVEKMPGIRCECSGRSAGIFVATMRNS